MKSPRGFLAVVAALAVLLASIVVLQNKLTALSASARAPKSMAYLPGSDKIGPFFLGFKTAFADFLWIKTTLYFGGHLLSDKQFPWLIGMVDMVTRLNPHFYPAYEFAGLMVPDVCKNPQAAEIILQRGISSDVNKKWKLYFYLGMLYYKNFGDCRRAAIAIATAAQLPEAPVAKLLGVATAMMSKTQGEKDSRAFEYLMYSTSENPEVRRYLQEKLARP